MKPSSEWITVGSKVKSIYDVFQDCTPYGVAIIVNAGCDFKSVLVDCEYVTNSPRHYIGKTIIACYGQKRRYEKSAIRDIMKLPYQWEDDYHEEYCKLLKRNKNEV